MRKNHVVMMNNLRLNIAVNVSKEFSEFILQISKALNTDKERSVIIVGQEIFEQQVNGFAPFVAGRANETCESKTR